MKYHSHFPKVIANAYEAYSFYFSKCLEKNLTKLLGFLLLLLTKKKSYFLIQLMDVNEWFPKATFFFLKINNNNDTIDLRHRGSHPLS